MPKNPVMVNSGLTVVTKSLSSVVAPHLEKDMDAEDAVAKRKYHEGLLEHYFFLHSQHMMISTGAAQYCHTVCCINGTFIS